MPTGNGFSFDGLVNRLRIGSARLALEVRDSPAIYTVFDMLANSENLLGSPFRVRRKTLERFFESSVPRSSPLYLVGFYARREPRLSSQPATRLAKKFRTGRVKSRLLVAR
jgi:ATP-dependent DNA ligase